MTTGKGFHRYDPKSKRNDRKFDVGMSEYKKLFMAPGATNRDSKGRNTVKVRLQPHLPLI